MTRWAKVRVAVYVALAPLAVIWADAVWASLIALGIAYELYFPKNR